jgi:hypothetical protein
MVGFYGKRAPAAWLNPIRTNEQGQFTVHGVPERHGVMLLVPASDDFAPQEIMLNTGLPEQRGERDGTYRPLVRNVDAGREAVLPLAPAQIFEGVVTYEDTGRPAPHARLTIWASQEEYGSMVSVSGMADAEGRYRIHPKPGIRFGVIAYPPDGVPYLAHQTSLANAVRWREGDVSRQHNVSLRRGILVRGKIVETGSNVDVSGATIQYVPQEADNPNAAEDIVTGWQGIQLSNEQGEFEIVVLPGPGWLLVHGPQGKYVLQEIAGRQLVGSKPGGRRNYAHAIHKVNPDFGAEPMDVNIALRPGATVTGTIADAQHKPVDEVLVISRLVLAPGSLEWSGHVPPTQGGRFELSGLDHGTEYPVHFLAAKRRLGATLNLRADTETTTVVLKPCGAAHARFVDSQGRPHVGYQPGLRMAITPGAFALDFDAMHRGELAADEDFVANINQTDFYWNGPRSDEDGNVTFEELIPGASYRIWNRQNGKHTMLKQFAVKAGENLNLGEITIERND